jgi:catechol 2,3-dioxygenase-like lactoylglutathione lyase family enzyme
MKHNILARGDAAGGARSSNSVTGSSTDAAKTGSEVREVQVHVRYMIDDVEEAVAFYTSHLGFKLAIDAAPAFAAVTRGPLRLLLSGLKSSGRSALPDGSKPVPGGWNRIQLIVDDIETEAARLRAAGVTFRRNDVVSGPGGSQIWIVDPSGNLVELFQAKD